MTQNEIQEIRNYQESIKTLRTNIEFAGMEKSVRSVLLTSAVPGEGKSTIALSLALSSAEKGRPTLLVENDFRKPQLGKKLRIRSQKGLVDLLEGSVQIRDVIYKTHYPNLYFLDIGGRIQNPVELLGSQWYFAVIEQLKATFEFVVFDAPPIGSIIDGALVASHVDGVLLVIRAGRVDAGAVKNVVSQLDKAGATVLGAVLNDVERWPSNYRYYDNEPTQKTTKRRRSGS